MGFEREQQWHDYADRLKARIKELEDGACRYNCRTAKEAFMAGYQAALPPIGDPSTDREHMEAKYKQWQKDRK